MHPICVALHEVTAQSRLHGVHRTRQGSSSFTWHQPCNNQKTSAVSTPLGWIFKTRHGRSYSHPFRIACNKSAVSLLESGKQHQIKVAIISKTGALSSSRTRKQNTSIALIRNLVGFLQHFAKAAICLTTVGLLLQTHSTPVPPRGVWFSLSHPNTRPPPAD